MIDFLTGVLNLLSNCPVTIKGNVFESYGYGIFIYLNIVHIFLTVLLIRESWNDEDNSISEKIEWSLAALGLLIIMWALPIFAQILEIFLAMAWYNETFLPWYKKLKEKRKNRTYQKTNDPINKYKRNLKL